MNLNQQQKKLRFHNWDFVFKVMGACRKTALIFLCAILQKAMVLFSVSGLLVVISSLKLTWRSLNL